MNSSRMIVALLLLGVVAVGFGQGLSLEKASAVITSYSTTTFASTWTSTSYYYYERTSTSVALKMTTVTALSQKERDGPYLKIVADARGRTESGVFVDLLIEAKITNLMNNLIKRGRIIYLVYDMARTVTEEALVPFWEIKVGETIEVKQGVPITKKFTAGDAYYVFLRAEIECAGITIQAPFATYTYSQRYTETLGKTYASTFTQVSTFSIEEPSLFLNAQTMLVLVAVAAVAVVAVIVLKMRKPSAPPPPQGQPSRQVCSSCGATVEVGSEFCHNCGKKME